MQQRAGGRRNPGPLIAVGVALFVVWVSTRSNRTPREGQAEAAPVVESPSAPAAAPGAPALEERAAAPERQPSEPEPEAVREVALVLERFPDGAPIANALLEVEQRAKEDGGDGALWPTTDAGGRGLVRVPAAARALLVRVPGFEPAERALAPGVAELRLTLTPSSGLFGRVLRADGTAAAAVTVELVASSWRVSLQVDESRPTPRSNVQTWRRQARTTTTDEEGWYVLDYPTRGAEDTVEVRARLAEVEGSLSVALPRAPEVLPDLVLDPPARVLLVRVLDPDGRAIPNALVTCRESPLPAGRDRTDERGELVVVAPKLPAVIGAGAVGYWRLESRHDGRVLPFNAPVEEPTARLELVLKPVAGTRARVVDAETRYPLFMARGHVVLVASGQEVGTSTFEVDSEGLAWVSFQGQEQNEGRESEPPELARITVSQEGYDEEQVFELDARAPPGPEPIELALRPLSGWRVLQGRVVRAGEAVARFQVGLKVIPRLSDPARTGWQYGRVYTDAEGRFALRWKPGAGEQAVTVYPHWTSWDEFAFLGPLSEDEAVAREHMLELRPAVHVPALVRGVVRGGSYRYFVSLRESEGAEALVVPTTINGVPIACEVDGELRTLLRLPADRRVQVTIGYTGENTLHPDGCAPVVHDPAAPALPLVFELQPLFLRVRGRVAGLAPDELAGLGVTTLPLDEPEASRGSPLARLEPDGTFEFAAPRGRHELFLVENTPGSWRTVRARATLELERDVEGLVLVAEPAPAAPR